MTQRTILGLHLNVVCGKCGLLLTLYWNDANPFYLHDTVPSLPCEEAGKHFMAKSVQLEEVTA